MKRYFVFLLMFGISLSLIGQSVVRDGFYVTTSDTIYGQFLVPLDGEGELNLARLQWRVIFLDDENNTHFFKPGEIEGFSIQDSIETLQYFKLELYNNNYTFIRLISDGYMRLYMHYTEMLAGGWSSIAFTNNFLTYPKRSEEDYFILHKSNQELIKVKRFSPKRKLYNYVSEYDDLALRIKTRKYGYTDVYRIVREYNTWYSTNVYSGLMGSSEE